jgi:hypothetical protein
MSKNELAVITPEKLLALDKFADENNLALLTEGKGAFTAALATATAIGQLRAMLTAEVLAPIMNLQGNPLGFRTDKERTGGYPAEVVADVMIDVTIRGGFKMYGNEVNIISGRGYLTKEGFQNWFRRASAEKKCGPVDVKLGVPKASGDGAIVPASATVKWGGTEVTTGPCEITVKGSGSDLQIGKATRKILARLFEKVTGVQVADGDTSEAIDIQSTPVNEGAGSTTAAPAVISDEQKQLLEELLKGNEAKANAYLLKTGAIKAGQTFLDIKPKAAASIIGRSKDFIAAITAE